MNINKTGECPRCGESKKLVELFSEDEGATFPIGCKECRDKQVTEMFGGSVAEAVKRHAMD